MGKKKKNNEHRDLLRLAGRVIEIEEQGLRATRKALGRQFIRAVEIFKNIRGRIIVIGIGKSGLVGRKLASTFTSTGTTAVFMHPAEALHGDLGLLAADDAVLALSFSGEADEVKKLLPYVKNTGVPIVSMTGAPRSLLARQSDVILRIPVKREADTLNLAPTASTTAMMALGDALAMALMKAKGFKKEDFARLHPGGALGRRLNLKAKDIMHQGKANPVIRQDRLTREALLVMTKTRSGAVNVIDGRGRLAGFFTDGDLRRRLNARGAAFLDRPVREVMTKNPFVVGPMTDLDELSRIFKNRPFDNMPVVDEKRRPVGLVDERDLL
ncbi:MAG: KpsF/GutQ family sugar-phosphate isomerase [Elusimicrobia bacterium]|nr:KpsF/GutQ family sugar-phosphate isomerase [Elusimicrobiota bacterium]